MGLPKRRVQRTGVTRSDGVVRVRESVRCPGCKWWAGIERIPGTDEARVLGHGTIGFYCGGQRIRVIDGESGSV